MIDQTTQTKQMRDMAARNTPYALNIHVTTSAGRSSSQKRMTSIVLREGV